MNDKAIDKRLAIIKGLAKQPKIWFLVPASFILAGLGGVEAFGVSSDVPENLQMIFAGIAGVLLLMAGVLHERDKNRAFEIKKMDAAARADRREKGLDDSHTVIDQLDK
tara:strand:- start:109 stop:435 length:327 start_codon:yes stop_codon:yes gene_type:complete